MPAYVTINRAFARLPARQRKGTRRLLGGDDGGNLGLIGAIAVGVLAIDLALLVLAAIRKRSGKPLFARRWSLGDVWFGIQLTLFAMTIAVLPILQWARSVMPDSEYQAESTSRALLYMVLPVTLIQNLMFFGIPAVWINCRYQLPLRTIGLPSLPRRRDLVAGLLLGGIAMLLVHVLNTGVFAAAHHFQTVPWVSAALHTDHHNEVTDFMRRLPHLGTGGLLLAILAIGIATPFGEEMVFRGFAFNAFQHRLGILPAVLISALIFTLSHGYGFGLISVFVMGGLMAWVYNNSGSLWVTILMHAVNNTLLVLIDYASRHR